MLKSSWVIRLMFGAVFAASALMQHFLNWQEQAPVDWSAISNILGLFIFTVTYALDPPWGVRVSC